MSLWISGSPWQQHCRGQQESKHQAEHLGAQIHGRGLGVAVARLEERHSKLGRALAHRKSATPSRPSFSARPSGRGGRNRMARSSQERPVKPLGDPCARAHSQKHHRRSEADHADEDGHRYQYCSIGVISVLQAWIAPSSPKPRAACPPHPCQQDLATEVVYNGLM